MSLAREWKLEVGADVKYKDITFQVDVYNPSAEPVLYLFKMRSSAGESTLYFNQNDFKFFQHGLWLLLHEHNSDALDLCILKSTHGELLGPFYRALAVALHRSKEAIAAIDASGVFSDMPGIAEYAAKASETGNKAQLKILGIFPFGLSRARSGTASTAGGGESPMSSMSSTAFAGLAVTPKVGGAEPAPSATAAAAGAGR